MRDLIQWPSAKYWTRAWNPVIGCRPCSPACENCYAAAWAKRFGQSFKPHFVPKVPKVPYDGIVFCGNLTDLFGGWFLFPEDSIRRVIFGQYKVLPSKRNATYLWLTKRSARMCQAVQAVCDSVGDAEWMRHYFGFTAENQKLFDERVRDLPLFCGTSNLWLSLEPLLGPIDLHFFHQYNWGSFSWVVVGCESGPKRRPCKIEWVESIVDQCRAAGVPVFVKQIDIGGKCVADIDQFPRHLRIRQVPWAKKGENR